MRALDRWLQAWRIRRAERWIRSGDRLLDVGCHDRSLLDRVGPRVASATGVDVLAEPWSDGARRILRGRFPDDFDFPPASFDAITALAVLEHVEAPEAFAAACARLLAPGGRAILTVPHPRVDDLLDWLMKLGLADGMAAEEHHGFDVSRTVPLFQEAGLPLRAERPFQLGLNRLFVFERPAAAAPAG